MGAYQDYIENRSALAKASLMDLGCQPVLFVGSGISSRYGGGPSWRDLLAQAISENPLIEDELPYLLQQNETLPRVGSALVDPYHRFAWGVGREDFPSSLFSEDVGKDCYLKHRIAEIVSNRVPGVIGEISPQLAREIASLQKIRPNSIITTNYDILIEEVFPEYTPIIGQRIIRAPSMMIGEIFKIHGCVTEPADLVLTESDYLDWAEKKKYLSAKLLAFFLEHPVLIIGYAAHDENVIAVLRDIDEILSSEGELVENIFYVVHDSKINENSKPPSEAVLDLRNGKSMRVNCIHASDFSWIYDAFAASDGVENVNPKILRALMARTYDLVRHDIPKMTIEVNYQTLEQAASGDDTLPKLLGITSLSDPDTFNATYPHITTDVGKRLGYSSWHGARKLINKIKADSGIDLCSSDNQFHIAVKSGTSSAVHKYSEAAVALLRKVQNNESYDATLKKKSSAKKKK